VLKTFKKGGIHPAENKLSVGVPIVDLPIPKLVTIMVSQHIGAPSKTLVKKGDTVKAGQIIAQSAGFVSTNIHASASGKVLKIESIADATGYKKEAIIIETEGDEWEEIIDRTPDLVTEIDLDSRGIIDKISASGIVGLGGATFPTHVKLLPPPGMKAEILIINGVECEPYLTSDHQLMLEKGAEIVVGTKLLMRALQAEKAYIAIENNKPDAIERLTKLTSKYPTIDVVPLKVKYPQGGEKQLVKAVTGREVPSGALPISVGTVVNNVGTAFAVYEAVMKNKPLFERIVCVTGKTVKTPGNFRVKIGTPINVLIEAAGGLPDHSAKVISGGPMMGKAVSSLEIPVSKGTSGILIMDEKESHRKVYENCIRCGRCVEVCPMGLEPYLLMTLSEKKIWDRTEHENIMDCIECGSCSYTCPANRPLLDYIRYGKTTVGGIIRSRK
jgi:electron transport complex protein RnfC